MADPIYVIVRRAWRERDVPTLVASLSHEVEGPIAAWYLGRMRATEATGALIALLNSPIPRARRTAADALGKMEASEATEALAITAQRDPDIPVRGHALAALAVIAHDGFLDIYREALADRTAYMRRTAAYALELHGNADDVPALKRAQMQEKWTKRSRYRRAIRKCRRRRGD